MVEIGKISKPEVTERIKEKKKVYLVPFLQSIPFLKKNREEYEKRLKKYWDEVDKQIENLEEKVGKVKKIYHEFVTKLGEEGLNMLKKINEKGFEMLEKRVKKGAEVVSFEDEETLKEVMDWQKCMVLGFESRKVSEIVSKNYVDSINRRKEIMKKKIKESLRDGEAAILVVSENYYIQFEQDIELFYISPPSFDDIDRFIKDIIRDEKEFSPN